MAKKKVSKAKAKKTINKKPTRRRKTTTQVDNGPVVEVESLYKIINRIQLTKEPAEFIVKEIDLFVAENILKDAELTFKKMEVELPNDYVGIQYAVDPPAEKERKDDFDSFEEFPDEIIEDGQIFF